jgi:hypothetical protein
MTNTNVLPWRTWLTAALVAAMAVLVGGLADKHPNYALGLAALMLVTLLAFMAPVTHLTILLALTTIVPYAIEDLYHLGGAGTGGGGLQASDVFLLTGLLRLGFVMPGLRLTRRQYIVIGLLVLSLAFTTFEAWQGFRAGESLANVGAEYRFLAGGFAAALIAMATLAGRGAYPRMLRGLLGLGAALGLWGIAQWFLGVGFNTDFGVRPGVSLTTGGVGQLQGGLFAFPVAVTLAAAALISGKLGGWQRSAMWAVLALNTISLLLTFERTFWVATAAAVLLVALRSEHSRRVRALLSITVCVVIGITVLAAVSPSTLRTAEQRLLSIGQYQTDNSVRYRDVESQFVLAKIRAKPLLGWGLGDNIYWNQPWLKSGPPTEESYTHVGYLWLLWREGALGAGVILALLLLSCLWPGRARGGDLVAAIKLGSQASLVALLIVNITFPVFNQGSQAVYMVGFMVACAALPVLGAGETSRLSLLRRRSEAQA